MVWASLQRPLLAAYSACLGIAPAARRVHWAFAAGLLQRENIVAATSISCGFGAAFRQALHGSASSGVLGGGVGKRMRGADGRLEGAIMGGVIVGRVAAAAGVAAGTGAAAGASGVGLLATGVGAAGALGLAAGGLGELAPLLLSAAARDDLPSPFGSGLLSGLTSVGASPPTAVSAAGGGADSVRAAAGSVLSFGALSEWPRSATTPIERSKTAPSADNP